MDDGRRARLAAACGGPELPEHELALAAPPTVHARRWRAAVSWIGPGGRQSGELYRPASGGTAWPAVLVLGDDAPALADALAGRGLVALTSAALAVNDVRSAVAALLDYERSAGLTIALLASGTAAGLGATVAVIDRRVAALWLHAPRADVPAVAREEGLSLAELVTDLAPWALGLSGVAAASSAALVRVLEDQMGQRGPRCVLRDGDDATLGEVELDALADALIGWADG